MDHAATTPVRDEVLAAMLPYFSASFANASGGYACARLARQAIDRARAQIAKAIGAKPSEIYFTSGGTEADNWALMGVSSVHPDKRHIITTSIEHHAVLHTCQALERLGYEVAYLAPDERGRVSAEALRSAIRPDTLMVSVMMANNEIGTIEPIGELAALAHEHGALMHTDAVQAAGHIPVDVSLLGVDLLSMSAHKFGGPKGIGALYVRSGVQLDNLIFGGAQERSLRGGTENTPAIVGMGEALEAACKNMEISAAYVSGLRDEMEAGVRQIEGVHVTGDSQNRLPGHLHVRIDGANTDILLMRLDMAGVAASAGSACTSGASERSHVIRALGLDEPNQADIRFSLGENNTRDEVAAVISVLRQILNR